MKIKSTPTKTYNYYIPSHSDRPSQRWTESLWRRRSWRWSRAAGGCRWLSPGGTEAGTCALSSKWSACYLAIKYKDIIRGLLRQADTSLCIKDKINYLQSRVCHSYCLWVSVYGSWQLSASTAPQWRDCRGGCTSSWASPGLPCPPPSTCYEGGWEYFIHSEEICLSSHCQLVTNGLPEQVRRISYKLSDHFEQLEAA